MVLPLEQARHMVPAVVSPTIGEKVLSNVDTTTWADVGRAWGIALALLVVVSGIAVLDGAISRSITPRRDLLSRVRNPWGNIR